MSKSSNLTEGNVLSTLLHFTYPILLTLLLQTAYGTVDLLVVGHFSGTSDVSGVTIGSQLMQTTTAFFTGLAMGTTILIGQYIGAEKKHEASKVIGASIIMFSGLALLVSSLLVFFRGAIATLMQTPVESFSQTTSYLLICGFGAIFIVFYNLLGSIFRGIGDSKTPLITVSIACGVNIILDLVFVALLNLGASGAALATTIAQAISVLLSLIIIRKRPLPFEFSKKDITFNLSYITRIIQLGIPIALQSVLVSVSFLFITAIVNGFGVVASAAVGICEKITGLIMMVPSAFMQALSAFSAQNFGANRNDRAKKALKYGILISLCFGFVMAYLAAFHGTIFTRLFTSDADTTTSALSYLKSYSIDTVFVAIMFSMSGYFNGCGKTKFVMLHSVGSAFLIRIPLAYLFSTLPNTSLFIIGLATPASTSVQIILCIFYFMHFQKSLQSHKVHSISA
ncbi:MAG: MATE family efflux transporter [Lachnospiraceae bacterium]